MKLMAIDVSSTVMAFAFGTKGGRILEASWTSFKGDIYVRLGGIRHTIRQIVTRMNPDGIVIEAPIPNPHRGSPAVAFACYGAAACCAEGARSINPCLTISMMTPPVWRKKLLGVVKRGTGKEMTRNHILTVDPDLERFLGDDDGDDISDACGLWMANQ